MAKTLLRKQLLRTVDDHRRLYRDERTGIAWVEDTSTGLGHSVHPNIDATGSVAGMRDRGYWGRHDRTVSSHGFIFNIESCLVDDDMDRLAADACACGGYHGRPGERFRLADGAWSVPVGEAVASPSGGRLDTAL